MINVLFDRMFEIWEIQKDCLYLVANVLDSSRDVKKGRILGSSVELVEVPLSGKSGSVSSDINVEAQRLLVVLSVVELDELSSDVIIEDPVVSNHVLNERLSCKSESAEIWLWDGLVDWVGEANDLVSLVENVVLSSNFVGNKKI